MTRLDEIEKSTKKNDMWGGDVVYLIDRCRKLEKVREEAERIYRSGRFDNWENNVGNLATALKEAEES